MATKPSMYINWVPSGSASAVIQPPVAQSNAGWTLNEAPPCEYMNYLFFTLDQWVQWFDQTFNYDTSQVYYGPTNSRMIGGGMWSFSLSSQVLAWSLPFYVAVPAAPDSYNACAAGSVTIAPGQVAYVTANVPFSTTASIVSGSYNATVAYVGGIYAGQQVSGTGIPTSTTVASIAGNVVTLSNQATATSSSATLSFSNNSAISASVATEASFVPAMNQFIFARALTSSVVLGINAGESILYDQEVKTLRGMGYGNIYMGTAGAALTAGQAVYLSSGSGDGGRTAGVYPADSSITYGPVRSQIIGVVMTNAASGAAVNVITSGVATLYTGLTPGQVYYLDPTTPGHMTLTKPSTAGQTVVGVGTSLGTTSLLVNEAGASTSSVVIQGAGQGNYGVTTEAQLTAALAACATAGGGVIICQASFTVASPHVISSGTKLLGQFGQTNLTMTAGGSFSCNTNAALEGINFVEVGANTILYLAGNYCVVRQCGFAVISTSTAVCIDVTGVSNRIYNCVFSGVSGESSSFGIVYDTGSLDNLDDSSVFLP